MYDDDIWVEEWMVWVCNRYLLPNEIGVYLYVSQYYYFMLYLNWTKEKVQDYGNRQNEEF